MRRFHFIFFFFSFFLPVRSFAQSHHFTNYNTESGLPQSQVLSIYQDEKGYMWFGTNSGGVSKFDGTKFQNFGSNEGLSNNSVFSICGNGKGELYFGTGHGFSVYNGFEFKVFDEKKGLTSLTVYKTLYDNGKVWLGTDKGVFLYENQKVTPFNLDSILNIASVYTIFKDQNSNIWFGTMENGLIRFNPKARSFKNFTKANGLLSDFIFSIGQRMDGAILVGTQTGLSLIFEDDKIKHVDEIGKNINVSYTCMESDKEGIYYFGSFGEGLIRFDFDSKDASQFKADRGFTNSPVLSILKDREGNIWIGTSGTGVYKYSGKKFTYYTMNDGLPDKYVSSVLIDDQKSVWAAITGHGVVRIRGKEIEYFKADFKDKNKLQDENVNCMTKDRTGRIYFGTEEGLCFFENNIFITPSDPLIRNKYIHSLFSDSNGDLWIGTTSGALKYSKGVFVELKEVNSLKPRNGELSVYAITEDRAGGIWFATDNGVIQLQNEKAKLHDGTNGFMSGKVCALTTDTKGSLWLGTEKGLYLYRNDRFEKIAADHEIGESFICLLKTDHENNLFIGGNNGIDIISLTDFYAGKKNTKHITKYDGLLSRESNANACDVDAQNNVYIGTINGLEIYDASHDQKNKLQPFVHITGVLLSFGNESVLDHCSGLDSSTVLPKKMVLPYNKNDLSFNYSGISLSVPEKVRYKYKLLGLTNEWSPEVSKTDITYPSLPPGSYTLQVKAMNNDGVWNEVPASFAFEILPPWYKTWWFYTISVIAILFGIATYNAYRTKKLKNDNIKLERTVDIRTKELREEKEKVESINKEVTKQKLEIEHKNTEITDSIKYAKNIQEALLPALELTESAFDDAFVFYQPKDIVSGDFFWFYESESIRFIAAADCTGHGVPGAFMSIVGNTLLNEIIHQKNMNKPGDILLELHKGVKEALSRNEKESQRRDGMDIALCAVYKDGSKVEYAGANRPLWIYRKKNDFKGEVIKATKYPIGGLELEEERNYINHVLETEKGDKLYIFSDGFADQFGGPKGKKLMVANMHKLIDDVINEPAVDQKKKIKSTFDAWRGNHEQVDDVLVIGIKI